MRVHAALVESVLVLEIVGEAERAGEFPAGVRSEVSVARARIERLMADAEVGEAGRVVASDRNVAGNVGHDVMHAHVPAQIELRRQIAKSRYGLAVQRTSGKSDRS